MRAWEQSDMKEHRECALRAVCVEITTGTDPWRSTFSDVSETIGRRLGETGPSYQSGIGID
jgi:hypothetical protein